MSAANGRRPHVFGLDYLLTVLWKTAMACAIIVILVCAALLVAAKLTGAI